MPEPTAIMERGPSPGVIRHPIPTTISVNPMTTVEVGAPTPIDHHDCRLPASAVTCHINPSAVGREVIVKPPVNRLLYRNRLGVRSRRLLGRRLDCRWTRF